MIKKILILVVSLISLSACSTIGVGNYSEDYMHSKYVNEHSKFIRVNGLKIHYRVEGPEDGEPVLLLHGLLDSLHVWDDWTESLKDKYRVYRMDLPGFGLSYLPEGYDFYDQEKFLPIAEDIIDAIGLEKFHVAGNSLGGYVSWKYAAKNPDRIKSMVLLDPVSYEQDMPFLLKLGSNRAVNPLTNYTFPSVFVRVGLNQLFGDPKRLTKQMRKRYVDMIMAKGNKRSFAYIMRVFAASATDSTLGDDIKKIKVPTMLIWGEKDSWVPVEFVDRWKKDVPGGVEAVIYPDAGHMPMLEIPQRSVRDFEAFISKYE